jgi:hypothetical protein
MAFEDEADKFPRTSVTNYRSTLHNIPEQPKSQTVVSFILSGSTNIIS